MFFNHFTSPLFKAGQDNDFSQKGMADKPGQDIPHGNSPVSLFLQPEKIDSVFLKVLTPNDDSSRHGVLVPTEAYEMFPRIRNFVSGSNKNYTEELVSLWKIEGSAERLESRLKHYHRYPERRLTRLHNSVNSAPPGSILVVGRYYNTQNSVYEMSLVSPGDIKYSLACEYFTGKIKQGTFTVIYEWNTSSGNRHDAAIRELAEKFETIAAKGYVGSCRAGPTGIGYTFETLMGIRENNSREADFKGIELKCFRIKNNNPVYSNEKRNLFLKEPTWTENMARTEIVRRYGYRDVNDREALYSCVTTSKNSHGFALVNDKQEQKVYLSFMTENIGYYTYSDLEKRLREKLNAIAFIGAKTKGERQGESFMYKSLTVYRDPSIHRFLDLLEKGRIMLEIRMHIEPNGTCRNHGSAFRISGSSLLGLYARMDRLYD